MVALIKEPTFISAEEKMNYEVYSATLNEIYLLLNAMRKIYFNKSFPLNIEEFERDLNELRAKIDALGSFIDNLDIIEYEEDDTFNYGDNDGSNSSPRGKVSFNEEVFFIPAEIYDYYDKLQIHLEKLKLKSNNWQNDLNSKLNLETPIQIGVTELIKAISPFLKGKAFTKKGSKKILNELVEITSTGDWFAFMDKLDDCGLNIIDPYDEMVKTQLALWNLRNNSSNMDLLGQDYDAYLNFYREQEEKLLRKFEASQNGLQEP